MKRLTLLVLLSLLCIKVQAQKTDSLVVNSYSYQQLEELVQFPELRFLKIYSYRNPALPDIFDQLPNLEYLEIYDASIKSIPVSIGSLSKLKTLKILHGSEFTTIPPEIGKLTQLTNLQVFNYYFTSIPSELGNLVNLEKVMLSGQLTALPPSISNWKKVKTLDLDGNNFREIPAPVFELSKLESLNLDHNELTRVTDSIRILKQLSDLSLSSNYNLEQLPASLCELHQLENLFIQNTKISTLPSCLNDLNALKRIRICETMIDDPAAFAKPFKGKIEWDWACWNLEQHLVNFHEIYGTDFTKLEIKKDSLILRYTYSYNVPNTIDEEFSQQTVINIGHKDSLKPGKIYTASNPLFRITTLYNSVWNWGDPEQRYVITGYLRFKKISKKEIVVYLNLDLIEDNQKTKLVEKLLYFK